MPIVFKRREPSPAEVVDSTEKAEKKSILASAPVAGKPPLSFPVVNLGPRPALAKSATVGKFIVYPDMHFADEQGRTKFIVSYRKAGLWYRLMGYDESEKRVKVASRYGHSFDVKIDGTVSQNYFVCSGPEGAEEPTKEVFAFIQEKLPGINPAAPEATDTPKKSILTNGKDAAAAEPDTKGKNKKESILSKAKKK